MVFSVFSIMIIKNPGTGDACLGAFLSRWLSAPENVQSAMKLTSATGANVAESDGLGNFSKVLEYEKKINVKRIF